MSQGKLRVWAGGWAVAALLSAGCTITIDPPGGGPPDPNQPGSQTIVIRVVNATNTTLDPELFVSAAAVSVDELFAGENKFTAFGVGTLGLLGPGGSDEFALSCTDARLVGTRGGKFGDDLNNPTGTGRQIVLTQDLNLFCGGSVTFTYRTSGSGFTTTFDVKP
jgi:hypothetical protein